MIKSNYNQFEVAPTELPRVLRAFSSFGYENLSPSQPSPCIKDVGRSLEELLETGRDDSNFEKVLLDDFWGVYIINVDNRFLIGEDDGMPAVHAIKVKSILDEYGIKYQLNA